MMLLHHAAEGSLCNGDYQDFSPGALSEIYFVIFAIKGSKFVSVSSELSFRFYSTVLSILMMGGC